MSPRRTWHILVVALAGALAVTLAARQLAEAPLQESLPEEQERIVAEALETAARDFDRKRQVLARRAAEIASDDGLQRALAALHEDEDQAVKDLVRRLASLNNQPLVSVEVYDPAPRLRAWNGFAMPMDSAPEDPDFLTRPQTRMSLDGDRRAALSVWHPVRMGARSVGAVRVMELVHVRMPVRNEYLSDVSLAEDWSRLTGVSVEVDHAAEAGPGRRLVVDDDGTPLIAVWAIPPSSSDLLQAVRKRFDNLAALWMALLVSVLAVGASRWVSRRLEPLALRLGAVAAIVGVWRVAWLLMRVPERWQPGKAPLSPLFDPTHLASGWGWGLFGTVGDLALTSLAALGLALLVLRETATRNPDAVSPRRVAARRQLAGGIAFGAAAGAMFSLLAATVHQVILDSTLGYFARSGLLPQRLVAVVFAALILLVLAAALFSVALGCRLLPAAREPGGRRYALAGVATSLIVGMVGMAVGAGGEFSLSEGAALMLFGLFTCGAATTLPYNPRWPEAGFYLRSLLLGVVLLAGTLYPILDHAVEVKERLRMEDAAESFVDDRDPRVLLAIRQVVRNVESDLAGLTGDSGGALDEALEDVLRGSLLASLGTYEVSMAVFDDEGALLGRNSAARTPTALARALRQDQEDLALLQGIRQDRGESGVVIEKITSPVELDRFDYIGVDQTDEGEWILVRASQHEHLPSGNTPFPRVLVPAGYYGSLYPDLSIAEFRDEVLVRSFGSAFGRSFLDAGVAESMETRERLWLEENIRDRTYITLYARASRPQWLTSSPAFGRSVVAVRRSDVNLFDRLYYLLRLTVSGLIIGLPVYLYGLLDRWRRGELPARQIRFRDKVLNAFFAVGLIVVVAMGWVGLRVVTGETDRAVESWLRQHLDRVENALALRAGPNEMPYRVFERIDVDSLAAQVGLDLNVYLGVELESTSRPQLVRDRLISRRIPIEAYENLFVSGFRFSSVDEQLGRFRYTAGYRALPDEQGAPRYVVSVQTLPEQERIEEERARTAAYLFGALLLLMVVVMVTASVIANALSRPVARLQRGLQNVAEGRFERIGPLRSRDEIADLVGTFNTMQDQLVESRRLLAHQERQLAWREMAQQVAHEIKNPLTPMKLSVQHLRRAFQGEKDESRFQEILQRITSTLIDQIDTLARIANEFSSFARMPLQDPERVDLNEVVQEAVSLMREHAAVELETDLHEAPLPVEADREALRRMYINFIKNGLEALEPNRPGRIVVRTRREVDPESGLAMAVSEVEDNGAGIPEDLRDRIFNPSFSTKTSGTGLGLAIAKNTVDELRGRIGYETVEGKGSTFWARFPLMPSRD